MRYLPREDAPFGDKVWGQIDETVIGAAKAQLAGRRLLEIVGPMGLGARVLDTEEQPLKGEAAYGDAHASMTAAGSVPVPLLQAEFRLAVREVAAAEERGSPLNEKAAAQAAVACARLEDALVFRGAPGVEGLMSVQGSARVRLGDWSKVGQPIEDLIQAANALDAAGFPGPYAAALAPPLYNALFRRYEQGNQTQIEHARQIVTSGLVKAPALESGGVVLAAGKHFAHIVLGRDMTASYVGPDGADYQFIVLESLCPRIIVPEAVCVLEAQRARSR